MENEEPSVDGAELAEIDFNDVALKGVILLISNDWINAQALFDKYREYSPLMMFGSSLVTVLQGMMSFEDERIEEALRTLKETEEKCSTSGGVFKSIKRKVKRKKKHPTLSEIDEKYTKKIISADCVLNQALLTLTNMDLKSYVKAGWLLRRAWKIYEHAKSDIEKLCKEYGIDGTEQDSATGGGKEHSATADDQSTQDQEETAEEILSRLRGAVCFGFGGFQLCMSLVPPKVLKLIEFLGFEGDRALGLHALKISNESKDMRAPLATLALLWYHTVIRPFFALDGLSVDSGVQEAMVLLEVAQVKYPDSSLVNFFHGRAFRLEGKLIESLETFQRSLEACKDQREIQLVCKHEIGWIHMMRLQWEEAASCFNDLKSSSKWSKSYYAYLTAICIGSSGQIEEAHSTLDLVESLVRKKNNQIERYVSRRAKWILNSTPTTSKCKLLVLEVLFLWNSLPACMNADLQLMLTECIGSDAPEMHHIVSLLCGAIHNSLQNETDAIQYYEECVAKCKSMKEDKHVPAYAMYELGAIYIKDPLTFAKGRQYLIDAKDTYKDFDFENRLTVKVHQTLKKIDTEGTPV